MKKAVTAASVLVLVLCVFACATNYSITSISGNVTKAQIESMLQYNKKDIQWEDAKTSSTNPMLFTNYNDDIKVYYLKSGVSFLGLPVNDFYIAVDQNNDTVCGMYFQGIYAGNNKEIVDKMLIDLSEQDGSPDIESDYHYLVYKWGNSTYEWGYPYSWGNKDEDYKIEIAINESEKTFQIQMFYGLKPDFSKAYPMYPMG